MTPNEIITRQFGKVMSGYRMEEVQGYLAEVAGYLEELLEEKDVLEQKMMILADKLEEYREDEDSLRAALIGAQKLGDSVVRDSKKKAEQLLADAEEKHARIIAEAKLQAEEIISDIKQQVEHENDTLHKLQAEVARFKGQIKEMLYRHLEILNSIDIDEKSLNARQKPPAEAQRPPETETAAAEEESPAEEEPKLEFVVTIDEDAEAPGQPDETTRKESRHGKLMFGEDYAVKRKD